MAVFGGPGPAEDNGASGPMQSLATAALELDFVLQGWRLFEEKGTFEYSHCFETSARKILVLIAGLRQSWVCEAFICQNKGCWKKEVIINFVNEISCIPRAVWRSFSCF